MSARSSVNVYLPQDTVHERALLAFYEGCPVEKKLRAVNSYTPSDVAVVFGIYKSKVPQSFARGKIIAEQKARGLTTVVLETGYLNRGDGEDHHYAAGLNGLNGRADFRNEGMPPDRFQRLNIEIKPWKVPGEYIILCGQVPWDASVDHIDFSAWLVQARDAIQRWSDHPIVFRPHPKVTLPPLIGCLYSTAPLNADLQNAHACVTFNSNSAVEAVLEGVPVFAFDQGSMALEVANRRFEDIVEPQRPSRFEWASDLAYAQWTLDEMREGLAWKHLFL